MLSEYIEHGTFLVARLFCKHLDCADQLCAMPVPSEKKCLRIRLRCMQFFGVCGRMHECIQVCVCYDMYIVMSVCLLCYVVYVYVYIYVRMCVCCYVCLYAFVCVCVCVCVFLCFVCHVPRMRIVAEKLLLPYHVSCIPQHGLEEALLGEQNKFRGALLASWRVLFFVLPSFILLTAEIQGDVPPLLSCPVHPSFVHPCSRPTGHVHLCSAAADPAILHSIDSLFVELEKTTDVQPVTIAMETLKDLLTQEVYLVYLRVRGYLPLLIDRAQGESLVPVLEILSVLVQNRVSFRLQSLTEFGCPIVELHWLGPHTQREMRLLLPSCPSSRESMSCWRLTHPPLSSSHVCTFWKCVLIPVRLHLMVSSSLFPSRSIQSRSVECDSNDTLP